jgi:acid phosphatase type 7
MVRIILRMMRLRLFAGLIAGTLLSLSLSLVAAGQPLPLQHVPAPAQGPTGPAVELKIDVKNAFEFAAFGDLRETNVANHTSSDPERRQAIIAAMAALDPKFILVSGDLVLNGENGADWAQWDLETSAWKEKRIELLPALGNHDLHGNLTTALGNYFQRFPELKQSRYYSARAGNVLVLVLDTALPTTSGPQFDWMKDKVEHLSKDTAFVLFLLHHPPVTHSSDSAGGHSIRPAEAVLGRWLEETQAKSAARFVVMAGHVHNYERYERNNVLYFVSGGGGATPYMIPRAAEDAYKEPGPTYHYLKIDVDGPKMRIGMEKLEMEAGKAVWNERDVVSLTVGGAGNAKK